MKPVALHRRQFLAGTGTIALACSLPVAARAQSAAGAQLNAVMDRVFWGDMRLSPAQMTALGIDTGKNAWARHHLGEFGRAGIEAEEAHATQMLNAIRAIPTEGLDEPQKVHHAVVTDMLEKRLWGAPFGMGSVYSPYVLSHMGGSYSSIPSFMDTKHPVESEDDAVAYLQRMVQFGQGLDDETALQREQAAKGYLAPAWSLDIAIAQIRAMAETPVGESRLVNSLAERAQAAGIAGDWGARAAAIMTETVNPALLRQAAMLEELKPTAAEGDGVWRVPNSEELYRLELANSTTTDLTAEEIHQIGLRQVAELSAELETMLAEVGLTTGTVGERLTQFNSRPEQLYPNTPEGRAAMLADLNASNDAMQAKLPQAFATLPTQPIEIRAVPAEIQDGAPLGYYESPTLDGSRPGIYYINLKHTEDWPKYTLPALTYHEAVPGHHLHGSLVQQAGDTPMLLKNYYISAYGEGWALYAEQLASELNGYEGMEKAGALQSWLFRAARLVVDTGLHHKKWSVEQGTQYFVDTVGFTRTRSEAETRRYCIWPGQACSYKIGKNKWVELRAKAEAELGDRFDIRQFHEIVKEGNMPLNVLEARVDRWIAAQKA